MHEGSYFTYIVASRSHTLYVGMTGNLHKRVFEHKDGTYEGFSSRYACNRLKSLTTRVTPSVGRSS
jgi:putative endonuclease